MRGVPALQGAPSLPNPCKKRLLSQTLATHPLAGMPVTSVRELRVLQTCKHPNLVELKRVVTGE